MAFKDHYKVLGVSISASYDELKNAYRRLALQYHPDRTFGDALSELKFKEIQEAYSVLANSEKRKQFDQQYHSFRTQKNSNNNSSQANSITSKTFLEYFKGVRSQLVFLEKDQINQPIAFEKLNARLDNKSALFLLSIGDLATNDLIVEAVLDCCKKLDYRFVKRLTKQLELIASPQKKSKITWYRRYRFAIRKRLLIGLFLVWGIVPGITRTISDVFESDDSSSSSSYSSQSTRPSNGDLYTNPQPSNPSSDPFSSLSDEELKDLTAEHGGSNNITDSRVRSSDDLTGWEPVKLSTGSAPDCYNYSPKVSRGLNNKLEVSVGSNTDVVIKLINQTTEKCVRYVYIRSGSDYDIKNIPEGKYYLKLAYGKDWRQKIKDGRCQGKFASRALYKRGDEILDFNKRYNPLKESYSIPSYSLKLDVIATDYSDQFSTNSISEESFNE